MLAAIISNYGIQLRPINESDLERILQWRNHNDVASYMVNTREITIKEHLQWFNSIKNSDHESHFLAFYRSEEIGVVNIKAAVDGCLLNACEVIEIGMYLVPESKYRGTVLAFLPALAINDYCFESSSCKYLQANVIPENHRALRFNQALGYVEVGRRDGLIKMMMDYKQYSLAKEKLKKIIRF